jgi:hypothetical protein
VHLKQCNRKCIGTPKIDVPILAFASPGGYSSGEYRLAGPNQQVIADLRGERVPFALKLSKLGFEFANALLETTHFVDHAEIWPANVAE